MLRFHIVFTGGVGECVKIEISSGYLENAGQVYTAQFFNESGLVAEIREAPHDIARSWAEAMKAIHDDIPEIKSVGVCMYCGSHRQAGDFCGDCQRVFRAR
jgi:hypothetical protein